MTNQLLVAYNTKQMKMPTLKETVELLSAHPAKLAEMGETAIEKCVVAAKEMNPLVQEVYAAQEGHKLHFFTVVLDEGSKEDWYNLERDLRMQFPFFSIAFRVVSNNVLTQEQIKAFREEWLPLGRQVYRYI